MSKEKDNNFQISGLFNNNPIEIENDDEEENNIEVLSKIIQLPEELQNMFEHLLSGSYEKDDNELSDTDDGSDDEYDEDDYDEDDESLENSLQSSIDSLLSMISMAPKRGLSIGKKKKSFSLNTWKTLTDPDNFSAFLCLKSNSLKEDFYNDFGKEENFSMNKFAEMLVNSEHKIEFSTDDSICLLDSTDKYIFAELKPSDEKLCSLYIAFFKNKDNQWEMLIPIYGNSYDPKNGSLLSIENNPSLFNLMTGEFLYGNSDMAHFGLDMALTGAKNTLFTPTQFGTIQNGQKPITDDGNTLYIGKITSNESEEAIMFKKDNCLNEEEKIFDFYIRFNGREIASEDLQALSDWFLKINWNDTYLMKNSDLYVDSNNRFYILCDRNDYFDNLSNWKDIK